MRSQSAAGTGNENSFAAFESGFLDGFEGDGNGACEETGVRPGDFIGDFHEGVFADGEELSHAARHAVTEGLSARAESFEAPGAEVTAVAGVGQEPDDVVAGFDGCDCGAYFGHDTSHFVARDEGSMDAASEGAVHDEEVVVA